MAASDTPEPSPAPVAPSAPLSPSSLPLAALEGLTGRQLILVDVDAERAVEKSLKADAGISVASVARGDNTPLGEASLKEGEAILFGDLGVAVVNAPPDQLPSVSLAIASNAVLHLMEPERFVYAATEVDLTYLRGFRDAVNHLYDVFSGPQQSEAAVAGLSVAAETQYAWGLQVTGVAASSYSGAGVKLAILDTGLDLGHPDFTGRAIPNQSFISGEAVQDGNGHGTHCAGLAGANARPSRLPRYGVAPEVGLLIGKVLANSGRGTDSAVLAGLRWAIAEGADIVSMSLQGPVQPETSHSAIFEQVASRALDAGTLIIAAAGNHSDRNRTRLEAVAHPANCPSILAVGAVDRNLTPAYFTNAGLNINGGKVDISGPGMDIYSSWPAPALYRRDDGTSMATPLVAGIAALHLQQSPNQRGAALWAKLLQFASPLGASTRDVGAGLAQAPR